jgi:alpha-beta hydrolase superfamily lysophospholipase
MAEIEYIWTEDGLCLQGVHYRGAGRALLLAMHGMSGNFIENHWGNVLGLRLSEMGFDFIYAHNRGYCHVNDIFVNRRSKDQGYETKRIGVTYERFADCLVDISGWLKKACELGCPRVFLLGHSLGCVKVLHYLHRRGWLEDRCAQIPSRDFS